MRHARSEPAGVERLTNFIWTSYLWATVAFGELLDSLARVVDGGARRRTRTAAQGLVEWSLAAAVLAFVGIAAWQLAGTAITDAVNRTIINLNRAGA